MGRLEPASARTEQHCRDNLTLWREHWLEWRDGTTNSVLTRAEIWRELDRWLDMFGDDLKAKAR